MKNPVSPFWTFKIIKGFIYPKMVINMSADLKSK